MNNPRCEREGLELQNAEPISARSRPENTRRSSRSLRLHLPGSSQGLGLFFRVRLTPFLQAAGEASGVTKLPLHSDLFPQATRAKICYHGNPAATLGAPVRSAPAGTSPMRSKTRVGVYFASPVTCMALKLASARVGTEPDESGAIHSNKNQNEMVGVVVSKSTLTPVFPRGAAVNQPVHGLRFKPLINERGSHYPISRGGEQGTETARTKRVICAQGTKQRPEQSCRLGVRGRTPIRKTPCSRAAEVPRVPAPSFKRDPKCPYRCPVCGKKLGDIGGYWGCVC